mmetsp:Transcript_23886/g.35306  ORF Transcript_23886/g.35306 Transcript_23886/m.35306 type:complete len:121 (+) Transcript_23886:82-444(+)
MSVIDWDEAMEQCGDDEEFLRELLADLRQETTQQVEKMEETIGSMESKTDDDSYHRIMRASHVIKGAASNLMCEQLRTTAMNLETSAKSVDEFSVIKEKFDKLKSATEAYCLYLESIGVE